MYKYQVPISIESVTEHSKPIFVEEFRKGNIERVFLTCLLPIYRDDSSIWTYNKQFREAVKFFKDEGFEVGIWIGGFGHGAILTHETRDGNKYNYQDMMGVDGDIAYDTFCPFDKNFTDDYLKAVKEVAIMQPDLIMLDDDYRLNQRSFSMGCCCPLHLEEYYKRIGEEIPRGQLETLIFSGGKNKYRSEWLNLQRDTLVDFTHKIRNAVDEVNENIRVSFASCFDSWDFSGTDPIELSKIFAGNTAPYFRTICPPYIFQNIGAGVEYSRMQAAWCKNSGIELFTEGDVYPRPRQNVPAKLLEMYDIALMATGELDGIMKYMYCYEHSIDYEKGYINAHLNNSKLREEIGEIFQDKKAVGVRIYEAMHKLENWVLPEKTEKGIAKQLEGAFWSRAQMIVSQNAVPVTYDKADVTVVLGENARYISEEELKFGAVLDIVAAKILSERGIDTGIISSQIDKFYAEEFPPYGSRFAELPMLHKMNCKDNVKVLTRLLPDKHIGSYLYENAQGQRFYVVAFDAYNTPIARNSDCYREYFNNYYRQEQLINAIEWIGNKPLPIVCLKNPFVYTIAAKNKDESKMSVLLLNVFMDEIDKPIVKLDREYKNIRFVNCSGELLGNELHLSRIEPYGIVAFEVEI